MIFFISTLFSKSDESKSRTFIKSRSEFLILSLMLSLVLVFFYSKSYITCDLLDTKQACAPNVRMDIHQDPEKMKQDNVSSQSKWSLKSPRLTPIKKAIPTPQSKVVEWYQEERKKYPERRKSLVTTHHERDYRKYIINSQLKREKSLFCKKDRFKPPKLSRKGYIHRLSNI